MAAQVDRVKVLEHLADARVRDAVPETCATIQRLFPEAEFHIYPNPEHRGAIIEVYADSAEVGAVFDLVVDRHVQLLVEEDLSLRVWPLTRVWLRPDA